MATRRRGSLLWAVELRSGAPVAARGPLHWSEISPFLVRLYGYSAAKAAVLASDPDRFEHVDRAEVVALAATSD